MDNVTHTMVGATLARVGLDRRSPLAAATLMIAANAPDLDLVAYAAGGHAFIAYRRGWTHGPLALVVLPLVVMAAMLAWDRFVRRRRNPALPPADARWTLILAAIGVLSHPLLDWLNTYGVRFLMPFRERWFYGDAMFIIDIWLWLILGTALVLARRGAAVGRVRAIAGVALAYIAVLNALGRAGEHIAYGAAAGAAISGVTDVMYQPVPANPLAAELIVVTDDAYHGATLRWTRDPRITFDRAVIPRGDWADARVATARRDRDAQYFLVWARYPYVRIEPDGGVFFGDARFPEGRIGGALSGVRVGRP